MKHNQHFSIGNYSTHHIEVLQLQQRIVVARTCTFQILIQLEI